MAIKTIVSNFNIKSNAMIVKAHKFSIAVCLYLDQRG